MKIRTNKDDELREKLKRYLDYLDRKTHIECLPTLNRYRVKLDMDEFLQPKELNLILKFLVRDVDQTVPELKQIFKPLVRAKSKTKTETVETATLESFLDSKGVD